MSHPIVVPELGESVTEATILRWRKEEGEAVEVGEILLELETEKVNLEVGCDRSGVLEKIEKPAGSDVKVGEVIGAIGDIPEGGARPAKKSGKQKEAAPANGQAAANPAAAPAKQAVAAPAAAKTDAPGGQAAAAPASVPSTAAPRPAPASPPSTAPVSSAPAPAAPPALRPAPPLPPEPARRAASAGDRSEERVRMSRRRQTIARRLVEAQHTAAMLTTFNEVDMTAVMALRAKHKDRFEKRHGLKLGIASFFVKATIYALGRVPDVNAEIQGDEILHKHYYDIGVAMDAAGGLVVPVLRDADALSLAGIEHGIQSFARKAQTDALTLEDLRGGCITITNGGVFGSLLSTPILNPPQVAILGLHKIEPRPIALDGQVVIRPMMYVALSYDHRIVDGRQAVQFLVAVKEAIEDPLTMWMDE